MNERIAPQPNDTVKIPKWVMAISGTALSVVFAGLLAWLTSMNVAIQENSVDIAAIKAWAAAQEKATDEVNRSLSRLDEKIDRILERVSH